MEEGKCRSCHTRVLWATTVKGKQQPLDPVPLRRVINPPLDPADVRPQQLVAVQYDAAAGVHRAMMIKTWPIGTPGTETDVYMPHHATCPKAETFRCSPGRRSK